MLQLEPATCNWKPPNGCCLPSRRVACMPFSLVLWFGAASAVSNASLFFYQHIAKTGGTSWSWDLARIGPLKHCVADHAGERHTHRTPSVAICHAPIPTCEQRCRTHDEIVMLSYTVVWAEGPPKNTERMCDTCRSTCSGTPLPPVRRSRELTSWSTALPWTAFTAMLTRPTSSWPAGHRREHKRAIQ